MCQTRPVLMDVTANVETTIDHINMCKEKGRISLYFRNWP